MLFKFKNYLKKEKVCLNENFLIPYTGHVSFTALLHLLRELKDHTCNNPDNQIYCLYVHENQIEEVHQNNLSVLWQQAQLFDLVICSVSLLDFFVAAQPQIQLIGSYEELQKTRNKKIQMFLQKLKDASVTEYLVWELRNMVITYVAKALHCKNILLADPALESAMHVLSSIALGRGMYSYVMSNFLNQHSSVKILFPMEIFKENEFIPYLSSCGYEAPKYDQIMVNYQNSCIQTVTKRFITNFDNTDFAISTVCKLRKKISSMDSNSYLIDHCILCHRLCPANEVYKLKSKYCQNFSNLISKVGKLSTNSEKTLIQKYIFKFHYCDEFESSKIYCFNKTENKNLINLPIKNVFNICDTCDVFVHNM